MPGLGAVTWELVFRGPEFQCRKMSKPWRWQWGPAGKAVSVLSERKQSKVTVRRQESGQPPNNSVDVWTGTL